MSTEVGAPQPAPCPRCGEMMPATMVRTLFWPQDDRPVIVERIPAYVCTNCMEQFYDPNVSDALRVLAETGFPREKAIREVLVPVFTLEDCIRPSVALPDDTYVD